MRFDSFFFGGGFFAMNVALGSIFLGLAAFMVALLTDGKNGAYRMQVSMPPHNGSYTYRVRAAGYETSVSKSTPFTEGETAVNFELQRKSAAKSD